MSEPKETVKALNLWQKLALSRVQLQEVHIKKSGSNSFSKARYYELKDFMPHVNIIFKNLGLIGKFDIIGEESTLTIINTDTPGEQEVFHSPTANAGLKQGTEIQNLGSQHTYLKRYLYMNVLEISETDVVESLGDKEKATAELASVDQIKKIKELYNEDEIKSMLARLKKTEDKLTLDEAEKMIKAREKDRKATKNVSEQKEPKVGLNDL